MESVAPRPSSGDMLRAPIVSIRDTAQSALRKRLALTVLSCTDLPVALTVDLLASCVGLGNPDPSSSRARAFPSLETPEQRLMATVGSTGPFNGEYAVEAALARVCGLPVTLHGPASASSVTSVTHEFDVNIIPDWEDECKDVFGYARPEPVSGDEDAVRSVLSTKQQTLCYDVLLDCVEATLGSIGGTSALAGGLMQHAQVGVGEIASAVAVAVHAPLHEPVAISSGVGASKLTHYLHSLFRLHALLAALRHETLCTQRALAGAERTAAEQGELEALAENEGIAAPAAAARMLSTRSGVPHTSSSKTRTAIGQKRGRDDDEEIEGHMFGADEKGDKWEACTAELRTSAYPIIPSGTIVPHGQSASAHHTGSRAHATAAHAVNGPFNKSLCRVGLAVDRVRRTADTVCTLTDLWGSVQSTVSAVTTEASMHESTLLRSYQNANASASGSVRAAKEKEEFKAAIDRALREHALAAKLARDGAAVGGEAIDTMTESDVLSLCLDLVAQEEESRDRAEDWTGAGNGADAQPLSRMSIGHLWNLRSQVGKVVAVCRSSGRLASLEASCAERLTDMARNVGAVAAVARLRARASLQRGILQAICVLDSSFMELVAALIDRSVRETVARHIASSDLRALEGKLSQHVSVYGDAAPGLRAQLQAQIAEVGSILRAGGEGETVIRDSLVDLGETCLGRLPLEVRQGLLSRISKLAGSHSGSLGGPHGAAVPPPLPLALEALLPIPMAPNLPDMRPGSVFEPDALFAKLARSRAAAEALTSPSSLAPFFTPSSAGKAISFRIPAVHHMTLRTVVPSLQVEALLAQCKDAARASALTPSAAGGTGPRQLTSAAMASAFECMAILLPSLGRGHASAPSSSLSLYDITSLMGPAEGDPERATRVAPPPAPLRSGAPPCEERNGEGEEEEEIIDPISLSAGRVGKASRPSLPHAFHSSAHATDFPRGGGVGGDDGVRGRGKRARGSEAAHEKEAPHEHDAGMREDEDGGESDAEGEEDGAATKAGSTCTCM